MARSLATIFLSSVWMSANISSAQIYWTQETVNGNPFALTAINRTNLDGSATQPFIEGLNHPVDLVIDASEGFIYWTESIGDAIIRSNLNGSDRQTLVNVNDPERLVISSASSKMYWAGESNLYGANLDGSKVEVLADSSWPRGEVFAIGKGHVTDSVYYVESDYFRQMGTEFWIGTVFRFDAADYSTKQSLFELGGRAISMAIDDVNSHLYWSDDASNIWRVNLLDGSDATLISTGHGTRDMFIDHHANRLWWTWEVGLVGQDPTGGISSTPLQGGAISTFPVSFRPQGIWVVPEPATLVLLAAAVPIAASLTRRRSLTEFPR